MDKKEKTDNDFISGLKNLYKRIRQWPKWKDRKFMTIAGCGLAAFLLLIFIILLPDELSLEEKFEKSQSYLASNEYDKAVALLVEVLDNEPKNVDAYKFLAEAYDKLGNMKDAREILEMGIKKTGSKDLAVLLEDRGEVIVVAGEQLEDLEQLETEQVADLSTEETSEDEEETTTKKTASKKNTTKATTTKKTTTKATGKSSSGSATKATDVTTTTVAGATTATTTAPSGDQDEGTDNGGSENEGGEPAGDDNITDDGEQTTTSSGEQGEDTEPDTEPSSDETSETTSESDSSDNGEQAS